MENQWCRYLFIYIYINSNFERYVVLYNINIQLWISQYTHAWHIVIYSDIQGGTSPVELGLELID